MGSSAMISRGRLTIAIAIIARWRIPPENSCGYCFARASGCGMSTRASAATASAQASSFDTRPCARRASAICRPTEWTGFIELIGSWKIIATSAPRRSRSVAADAPTSSRPSNRIDPVTRAEGGSSRGTAMSDTDLPEPDSPTTPSTSPGSTVKPTSRTAWTSPSSEGNVTERPSTSSSAMPVPYRRVWRGSNASRSPSPMKLMVSEISTIATNGAQNSHGRVASWV